VAVWWVLGEDISILKNCSFKNEGKTYKKEKKSKRLQHSTALIGRFS